MVIHEIAEQTKLNHESLGQGKYKKIKLSKNFANQNENGEAAQREKLTSKQK